MRLILRQPCGAPVGLHAAVIVCLTQAACVGPPGSLTVEVPWPSDSLEAFEPHIAVDPTDPERVTLLPAGYRYRPTPPTWCATVRAWTSQSGGRSWSQVQDVGAAAFGPSYQPSRSDFTLDPVVAPDARGGWYAVVIGGRTAPGKQPERSNDLVLLRASRDQPLGFAARVHSLVRPVSESSPRDACGVEVSVSRDGRTTPAAPFGSDAWAVGPADKPWLAVDHSVTATRGFVHVAWSVAVDSTGERFALYAARKRPGDSAFGPPVLIASPYRGLVHGVQIGVRPSGVVDVLWAENASGRRVVRHVSSTNGGERYTDPVDAIRRPDGVGQIRNLTLAYHDRAPAVCWTERKTRRDHGNSRIHESLWCARYGSHGWGPETPVDPDSLSFDKLTLGALAANQSGWWLLAYRSAGDSTHVELLRSADALRWRRYARLAGRRLAASDYELGAGVVIGDYVGLAATRDRVYSAYVLPADSGSASSRLYVTALRTERRPSDPPTSAAGSDAQAFLQRLLASSGTPAISGAVALHGRIVFSSGVGYIDLEHRVPATGASVYNIGSVSKPITGVAVMQLVEQGLVGLDQDIRAYVPEFPDQGVPITLRHLLTHTSGIRHYRATDFPGTPDNENIGSVTSYLDGLRLFAGDSLLFRPGKYHYYTSYGVNLLQGAVEKASGLPFEEYLRERIWKPAGMVGAGLDIPDRIVPHRARSYRIERGQVFNYYYNDLRYKFASGAMIASVEDLVRFGAALNHDRLLRPATRDQMFSPQTEGLLDLSESEPPRAQRRSQGLLWDLRRDTSGRPVAFHCGSVKGSNACIVNFYQEDLVAAIATNSWQCCGWSGADSLAAFFRPRR